MKYWLILLWFISSSVLAGPSVIAFFSSYITGAVIGTYSVIQTAFIYAAATFALTKLSEPKISPSYNLGDQSRSQTIRSSSNERRVVYGESKINGLIAYIGTTGSSTDKYLHLVLVWAHQESEKIEGLYINDEYVDTNTNDVTVTIGKFANRVWIRHHLGDQTEADSALVGAVPEWSDNHKLLGQTYSYIKIRKQTSTQEETEAFNDVFPYGIPTINAILKGKKIVDPRNPVVTSIFVEDAVFSPRAVFLYGSNGFPYIAGYRYGADINSFGGYPGRLHISIKDYSSSRGITLNIYTSNIFRVEMGGIQISEGYNSSPEITTFINSISIPSNNYPIIPVTIRMSYIVSSHYSSNPILCAADFIRSTYGLNTDNLRDYIFAANICDELITSTDENALAFKEKRYEMAAVIGLNEGKLSVLDKIRQSCDGSFYYSGGEWVLDVGRVKTPESRVITENDFTKDLTYSTHIDNRELFNIITPKIIDRGDDWRVTTAPNVKISSAIAEDHREIIKVIDYNYVRTATRALSLGAIALLKHRNKKSLQVVGKLSLLKYELGDVVSVELTNIDVEEVLFEVVELKLNGLEVTLGLHEYTDGVYADSPNVQFDSLPEKTYTNKEEFLIPGTYTWTVPTNSIGNNFRIYVASGKGGTATIFESTDDDNPNCSIGTGTWYGGEYGWHNSIQTITNNIITVTVGGSGVSYSNECFGASGIPAGNGGTSSLGSLVSVLGGSGAIGGRRCAQSESDPDDGSYTSYPCPGSNGVDAPLRVGNAKGLSRVIIEWNV